MKQILILWCALALAWSAFGAAGQGPTLVIDTSGSMGDSDPGRHAVQFAKILGQTLGADWTTTAIFPQRADCTAGDRAVAVHRREAQDPMDWDEALEGRVRYTGPNAFGPALSRAKVHLGDAAPSSVLVLLADGGGRARAELRAQTDSEIARRVAKAGGRHEDVDVRVSLLWNTRDDLDLYVTAPSGEVISFGHKVSRCKGALDVDRNVGQTTRTPVENIRWATGEAPPGTYRVMVRNYEFNESPPRRIKYRVETVVGGRVDTHLGIISPRGETGAASDQRVTELVFDPNRRLPEVDSEAIEAELARGDAALNPTQGGCPDPLEQLRILRRSGARLVSITLGDQGGPFHGHGTVERSLRVKTAADLTAAVAGLARDYFGRRDLSQGAATGRVEVQVPEHTGRAWLLIAADGDLSGLRPTPGNPSAAGLTLEAAVGKTASADGRREAQYRVIELQDPQSGTWRFDVGNVAAGWLLTTSSRLDLRLAEPAAMLLAQENNLILEVVDAQTGRVLAERESIRSVRVEARFDTREVALNDAGTGPDRNAGDARFTGTVRPRRSGRLQLTARLHAGGYERKFVLPVQVVDARWRLRSDMPATHRRDLPLVISGKIEPDDEVRAVPIPPTRIIATSGDLRLELEDKGGNGDQVANDGIYSARWTPRRSGSLHFRFEGQGGSPLHGSAANLEIVDWGEVAGPGELDFGTSLGGEERTRDLDLSPTILHGRLAVELTAQLTDDDLVVGIEEGGTLRHLGPDRPVELVLEQGRLHWPLRVSVPRCAPRIDGERMGMLHLRAVTDDGAEQHLSIPLLGKSQPLPWYICLLPYLLVAASILLALFVIWGILSPARFPRTLGVMLSPEEDLDEGFFLLIRSAKGTGSGFYRNARAYITPDFRISGKRQGALICLVAEHTGPKLLRVNGQTVLHRNPEDEWEPLSENQVPARCGDMYRSETGTIYFELRNA